MEKLIELLNECVKEKDFWDDLNEYNEAEILDEETLEVNWKYHDIEYLCTKKFWFIKRLVEKHKINTRNLNLQVFMSMFSNDGTVEISYEELILMLLAISDDPIEFLIDVLK